jgi:hypothetical protein
MGCVGWLQVTQIVERKCQSKQELNKFKLYVDELEQVTYLLLKLSGRLAKAENAVIMLPEHASEQQRVRYPWVLSIFVCNMVFYCRRL